MKNNIEISGCTELNANELVTIEGGNTMSKVAYALGYLIGSMSRIQRNNPYNAWVF
jgi:hypothetical protein